LNYNSLREAAHEYHGLGLNVVLLKGKTPLHEWSRWEAERQSRGDFDNLPWDKAGGFALIGGSRLDNGLYFAAIDYDVKNVSGEAKAKGGEIIKRLPKTHMEETPSGGLHLLYLSRIKPRTVNDYHRSHALELIGEGKLCIMAPSKGYRVVEDRPPRVVEDVEGLFYDALGVDDDRCREPDRRLHLDVDVEVGPGLQRYLETLLEEIKSHLDIVGESGKWIYARCPFHRPDRHPSFAINKDKLYAIDYHDHAIYNMKELAVKLGILEGRDGGAADKEPSIDELIERSLKILNNSGLHPFLDYKTDIGLTMGAPLYSDSPKHKSKYLIFIRKEPKIVQNDPIEKKSGFSADELTIRTMKWPSISTETRRQIFDSFLEFRNKGRIDFPSKNEIFQKIVAAIERYWYHSDPRLYMVLACYIFATYLYPIFNYFPILNPQGERETGKTTLLAIIQKSCWNPTGRETALREAGLFRTIQDSRPTYIIDITRLDPGNKNYIDIIDVCEAGTEKGGVVKRVDKNTGGPLTFEVYGPKVIATREELPFTAKCIRIITERAPDMRYAMVRHRLEEDPIWGEVVKACIRGAINYWEDVLNAYRMLEPTPRLHGRNFNYWAPILAVCKACMPEWYKELIDYAEEYASTQTVEDAISEVENALLRILLDEKGETYTATLRELTDKVKEEIPWVRSWHIVRSALENLHVVKEKYQARSGLTYRINLKAVHEKAEKRFTDLKTEDEAEEAPTPELKGPTLKLKPLDSPSLGETPTIGESTLGGSTSASNLKLTVARGQATLDRYTMRADGPMEDGRRGGRGRGGSGMDTISSPRGVIRLDAQA